MPFTASDGTVFEDRNEWRAYEFETNYTFKNKNNEKLIKYPGNIDGQPFDIADVTNCEITLLDHVDQVQVDYVTNSKVFIGPSSESVFVRNCTNCVFTVACKQLRTRDCTQCDFYLYTQTDPIIETSNNIRFAPFNGAYPGLPQHFAAAKLDPNNNHWAQVYDFNDPDKTGCNWSLMSPADEAPAWEIPLTGPDGMPEGPVENPVPRNATAFSPPDTGADGMQSFSFDTSQEQATNVMNEQGALSDQSLPVYPPAIPAEIPPPTPQPESWPLLEKFEAERAEKLEALRQKEQALIKEVRQQAELSLDKYYGERTDRLAHRAAANREQEETKIKTAEALKQKSSEEPWARVMTLLDANVSSKSKESKDSKDTKDAKKDGNKPTDLSRMRSILVQLKNSGGLEAQKQAA